MDEEIVERVLDERRADERGGPHVRHLAAGAAIVAFLLANATLLTDIAWLGVGGAVGSLAAIAVAAFGWGVTAASAWTYLNRFIARA